MLSIFAKQKFGLVLVTSLALVLVLGGLIKSARSQLSVQVKLPKKQIYLISPCLVEVEVRNTSQQPLLINSRLAIGYRDSFYRELFADLLDIDSENPARIRYIHYQRLFPTLSHYNYLNPGESISGSFDLFEWYAPPPLKTGNYQLVVYYQADELLTLGFPEEISPPQEVVRGVFSSDPIDLVILPGIPGQDGCYGQSENIDSRS